MHPVEYSIVVPLYNEEGSVEALATAVGEALGDAVSWELVLVDDGSVDGTADRARALLRGDPRIRLLRLARNFGQASALQAGFDHARGPVVVGMDGDLQNDPRDIPVLVAAGLYLLLLGLLAEAVLGHGGRAAAERGRVEARPPRISVLVPVWERPSPLDALYEEFSAPLRAAGFDFEFVFLVGPEHDGAAEALLSIEARGEPVRVVRLDQSAGESALLRAGASRAAHPVLLTLPAYPRIEAGALPEVIRPVLGGAAIVGRCGGSTGSRMSPRRACPGLAKPWPGAGRDRLGPLPESRTSSWVPEEDGRSAGTDGFRPQDRRGVLYESADRHPNTGCRK